MDTIQKELIKAGHKDLAQKYYKKISGKIEGPGVPDGTGPMKDDVKCPFNKELEEKQKEDEFGRKKLAHKKMAKITNAKEIVEILEKEKGERYAANWTGATDKAVCKKPILVDINRGKGFEKSVKVEVGDAPGYYIYMPPFEIDSMPTKDTMLVFKCGDAIYVNDK
jgi:hypothetical protein